MAELVVIAGPTDLHATIQKAKEIEMAKNLASGGQGQRMQQRGRGRFPFGRGGRFHAIMPMGVQRTMSGGGQQMQLVTAQTIFPPANWNHMQCWNCGGYGHPTGECQSTPCQGRGRGRGQWNYCGRRRGR